MIVFNLTDKAPPRKQLSPLTLRVFGKYIEPGGHMEFPDDKPLAKVSGWVYSGRISVDTLPAWYKGALKSESKAIRVVPDPEPELVTPKEE